METNEIETDGIDGHIAQFTESGPNQFPRLPACRFCHTRKTKCDNLRPKCSLCIKHGQECVTLAVDDNESVTRQYIGDLEQEVKSLEDELATNNQNDHNLSRVSPVATGHSGSQGHRENSPSFIEGGGISFMRHLFADSEWREHDPSLLQNLSKGSGPAEAGVKPADLPSMEQARIVFDKYLNGSHLQNPFLLRRDVQSIYSRLFLGEKDQDSERNARHDLFQAFMVLAIGSVMLYRNGEFDTHPYGFYLSALKYFDDGFLSGGLSSIQNLLLVGRFAIYHHVGTSIWEVTRLGMRMCVEQGLHEPTLQSRKIGLLEEQLQRRVFWECYLIDRYSSITLNRPFAIADKYIKIGLPADANDEEVEAAEASGAFSDLDSFGSASSLTAVPARTTEMSIFFACLKLRQTTSRIHDEFGGKVARQEAQNDASARGTIYYRLDKLLQELRQWRSSTPVFQYPQNLYQMQEWYDLLCLRERLLLVRKAIDIVPKHGNIPPRDLLSLCLECAVRAITCFCGLFDQKKITFTRSYFQMLFTAGVSVMFCLSVVKDFDQVNINRGTEAVIIGEKALKKMSEELPDAKHYVAVYEALRRYVIRKYSRQLQVDPLRNTHLTVETENEGSRAILADGALNTTFWTADSYPGALGIPTPGQSHPSSFHPPFVDAAFTPAGACIQGATIRSEDSILSWDIFENNALWDMEAGLNEYAYGDPPLSLYLDDSFDMQSMIGR